MDTSFIIIVLTFESWTDIYREISRILAGSRRCCRDSGWHFFPRLYGSFLPGRSNFDDHLSSCPRTLVPRYREWTQKDKDAGKGERRWTRDEGRANGAQRAEKQRERERERTREGKFGGDFQVCRVARVKAIHSITLWGYRDTLVRRTLEHSYVQHGHQSDGIMLEKLNFKFVKTDVFQTTKDSARRWINSCNSYRRISKNLSLLLSWRDIVRKIIVDASCVFMWKNVDYLLFWNHSDFSQKLFICRFGDIMGILSQKSE